MSNWVIEKFGNCYGRGSFAVICDLVKMAVSSLASFKSSEKTDLWNNIGFAKKFQPEYRFLRFFNDNAHSRDKLCLRSGSAYRPIIGSY